MIKFFALQIGRPPEVEPPTQAWQWIVFAIVVIAISVGVVRWILSPEKKDKKEESEKKE